MSKSSLPEPDDEMIYTPSENEKLNPNSRIDLENAKLSPNSKLDLVMKRIDQLVHFLDPQTTGATIWDAIDERIKTKSKRKL
jgi:hypothetical protein